MGKVRNYFNTILKGQNPIWFTWLNLFRQEFYLLNRKFELVIVVASSKSLILKKLN